MDTLTGIKVFRQVVESGSFVAAAERLDVSTANVSKHVMHIEKRLGVRLLNRNSRTLSLTEPGRVYFERCKTILDDLEETELELGSLNSAPRGTLRITAPSWFAGQALGEFLADYRRRFPEIVLDWSLDDRVRRYRGGGVRPGAALHRGRVAGRTHCPPLALSPPPDCSLVTATSTSMVRRVHPRNLRVTTWWASATSTPGR